MAIKQPVRASEGSLPKELIKRRKKVNRIFRYTGTKKRNKKECRKTTSKKSKKTTIDFSKYGIIISLKYMSYTGVFRSKLNNINNSIKQIENLWCI